MKPLGRGRPLLKFFLDHGNQHAELGVGFDLRVAHLAGVLLDVGEVVAGLLGLDLLDLVQRLERLLASLNCSHSSTAFCTVMPLLTGLPWSKSSKSFSSFRTFCCASAQMRVPAAHLFCPWPSLLPLNTVASFCQLNWNQRLQPQRGA